MSEIISCYIVSNVTQKVDIARRINSRIKLYICENENESLKVLNDAKTLFSRAVYYPAKDIFYYSADSASDDLLKQRLIALEHITDNEEVCIITTIDAALEKMNIISDYKKMIINLALGDIIDVKDFINSLVLSGYTKVNKIQNCGEYAIRGSIIDIYSYTMEFPIRIELFDDEIDSIRYFDIDSQRCIENIEKVNLFVARDVIKGTNDYTTLLEFFENSDFAIILDEPSKIITRMSSLEELYGLELYEKLSDFNRAKEILYRNETIALSELDGGIDLEGIKNIFIDSSSVKSYSGNIFEIIKDIQNWIKSGYIINVYSASLSRANRILKEFTDSGITASINNYEDENIRVIIYTSSIQHSFVNNQTKEVYISASDIFKDIKVKRVRKTEREDTEIIRHFSELKIDDIVVHDKYGIGKYKGIEALEVNGIKKDYLKIEYKNKSELHILATNISAIQKYIGNINLVTLSDINSDRWSKSKAKVKKQTDVIAKEIVALYAERMEQKGYSFSKDDILQKEMEELFEYVETDDQIKAIDDIKMDMESTKIMDRLLCGDVGFGKTEVAIRAAFKAVLDNKQVAILVPTTILANQHFNVIRERLKSFPVRISMLSRFVTPKNQKLIIDDINKGKIDIVVGTQSILKKDIVFKDLGLLIIDEEQRFGVKDKEKIKGLKLNVDCLALSATPIPRTLHMSLSGIRDLSLLSQAPYDRQAIQTYVLEFSHKLVKEAILREINRGGQIYFLHNRINDIDRIADEIRNLLPNLTVAVAHSKLSKRELEDIFYSFNNQEIDVLVSTTIVETGLDIPNVNTIIVNNADYFGLSSLYQLRGRVGRSNKRAYAYFMYKKGKNMTEEAMERLKAIREFTKLGSGIKIAMRDMEIRGTGSLLGNIQHGHIEAIGYDLYCRLLKESINEAKGEKKEKNTTDVFIDLTVDTHIDDNYIFAENDKLEMYKKFNSIYSSDDVLDIIDECTDRFGDVPDSVLNIIKIGYIKNIAANLGIEKISNDNNFVAIKFGVDVPIKPEKLISYIKEKGSQCRYAGGYENTLYCKFRNIIDDLSTIIDELKNLKESE